MYEDWEWTGKKNMVCANHWGIWGLKNQTSEETGIGEVGLGTEGGNNVPRDNGEQEAKGELWRSRVGMTGNKN